MKITKTVEMLEKPGWLGLFLAGLLFLLPACPAKGENPGGPDESTSDTEMTEGSEEAHSEAAEPRKEQVLVVATRLKREPILSYLEVSSDVESLNKVDLYSYLSGIQVTEVIADEGDYVEKGAVLARLETAEIELELTQAKVMLQESKQRLEKTRVAVMESAEREESARINAEKAKNDYDKSLSMFENDLVAEDQLLTDRLAWEQASSEDELAVFQKEHARLDLDLSRTEVEKNELAVKTAEIKLSRTAIKAPFSSFVTFRNATPGMTVAASTHLFTLVNPDELVTYIYVPQEEILRVKLGQPVKIVCDALANLDFSGTIDVINPVVDPTTGTVKLRARIERDDEGLLRPGMFISARVITASREDALLVPRKAIFYDDEKPAFFLINEDQTVRKIHFVPDATTESAIEIRSTLDTEIEVTEGALVVMVGQDNLKDSDSVEIVKEIP